MQHSLCSAFYYIKKLFVGQVWKIISKNTKLEELVKFTFYKFQLEQTKKRNPSFTIRYISKFYSHKNDLAEGISKSLFSYACFYGGLAR